MKALLLLLFCVLLVLNLCFVSAQSFFSNETQEAFNKTIAKIGMQTQDEPSKDSDSEKEALRRENNRYIENNLPELYQPLNVNYSDEHPKNQTLSELILNFEVAWDILLLIGVALATLFLIVYILYHKISGIGAI